MSCDEVADNWDRICDFSTESTTPSTIEESGSFLAEMLTRQHELAGGGGGSGGGGVGSRSVGSLKELAGFKLADQPMTVSARDHIIYALGIGCSLAHGDADANGNADLKYLYENHEDFQAFPSIGVVFAQGMLAQVLTGQIPGLEDFQLSKLLHGEQYLELEGALPTSGQLVSRAHVSEVLDKGSGALLVIEVDTLSLPDERLVCRNQFGLFLVGMGGFGGRRDAHHLKPVAGKMPDRKPDFSRTEQTSIDQAALYRMSGDLNPLHIDPSFAAMGGFDRPILHGLCSLGFALRHVVDCCCRGEARRVRAVKVRFSKPVIPGQRLRTDMWLERSGQRVVFQTTVVENGTVCLSGGYVELTDAGGQDEQDGRLSHQSLESDGFFEGLNEKLRENAGALEKIKPARLVWVVNKDGHVAGRWAMLLSPGGKSHVFRMADNADAGKVDGTLTMEDADLVALGSGQLNAQKAFMSGKMKFKGNLALLQRLGQLVGTKSKI